MIFGQKMSGVLAEEITTPGEGHIRALFVDGGNPVNAIPDQRKIIDALSQLDLLVTIDPFMTPTARLSHYVLPPKMMFERCRPALARLRVDTCCSAPIAQYARAGRSIHPPAGGTDR